MDHGGWLCNHSCEILTTVLLLRTCYLDVDNYVIFLVMFIVWTKLFSTAWETSQCPWILCMYLIETLFMLLKIKWTSSKCFKPETSLYETNTLPVLPLVQAQNVLRVRLWWSMCFGLNFNCLARGHCMHCEKRELVGNIAGNIPLHKAPVLLLTIFP